MISTHILDTSLGNPAAQVDVKLEKKTALGWELLSAVETNSDGRVVFNNASESGVYRLTFGVEAYFARLKQECFFQDTSVVFKIEDTARKYHVPLLLNNFGYSVYRGS